MTTDPTTVSGEVERVRGAILRVKDRYSRYADIPTDELADEILQALRVEPPSDVAREALIDIRNRILCPVGPSPSLDQIAEIASSALIGNEGVSDG